MKLMKENVSRKIDSLGRVSIPKAMRQRMEIDDASDLEFYTLENDDGELYICMTNHKVGNNKYEMAAKVLEELGIDVPVELEEKI